MGIISISLEPVTSTSLYQTPQTASDGGFAQSLQDTVDVGSTNVHSAASEQPAQSSELQESVQSQENAQAVQETQSQENTQAAQEAQPQGSTQAAQETQSQENTQAAQENVQATPETQSQQKTVPTPEELQADGWSTFVLPLVPLEETTDTDPDLMKELEDLLNRNEKMLSAPQRMQETIKSMISQAFKELNDPGVKEEEFTEMVLDFLMKFIQEKFGGKTEDTSIAGDHEDEDDVNVHDVLLQVVVQMLDSIRSEDAQTETPEDEEQAVDGIPSTESVDKPTDVVHIEPLTDESELTYKPSDFAVEPEFADTVKTEPEITEKTPLEQKAEKPAEVTPETKSEEIPEVQSAETVQDSELYQAAMQTAEAIYIAVTQPQQPEQSQVQPVRADRSREAAPVSPVRPIESMNELEELTRLVKGGDSVKSEQPQLQMDLGGFGDKQKAEAEQAKPAVKLEAPVEIAETVPFEAAIASTAPQITLTRVFGSSESGAAQIVTQIASEIFNQLPESGGTTTFVMTLNPESLGKVTVKLVEEAGKISVSVTAHEKRTAEILSQRFDTLQTAMKENGTQLEKYQVVYAPEKDEGAGHQNFDGSSKNPYVKQDDEEGEGDGEFAEILQQAV